MASDPTGLRAETVEAMAAEICTLPDGTACIGPRVDCTPANCKAVAAGDRALTALLSLLNERGWAIVPKVATEEMIHEAQTVWLALGPDDDPAEYFTQEERDRWADAIKSATAIAPSPFPPVKETTDER